MRDVTYRAGSSSDPPPDPPQSHKVTSDEAKDAIPPPHEPKPRHRSVLLENPTKYLTTTIYPNPNQKPVRVIDISHFHQPKHEPKWKETLSDAEESIAICVCKETSLPFLPHDLFKDLLANFKICFLIVVSSPFAKGDKIYRADFQPESYKFENADLTDVQPTRLVFKGRNEHGQLIGFVQTESSGEVEPTHEKIGVDDAFIQELVTQLKSSNKYVTHHTADKSLNDAIEQNHEPHEEMYTIWQNTRFVYFQIKGDGFEYKGYIQNSLVQPSTMPWTKKIIDAKNILKLFPENVREKSSLKKQRI